MRAQISLNMQEHLWINKPVEQTGLEYGYHTCGDLDESLNKPAQAYCHSNRPGFSNGRPRTPLPESSASYGEARLLTMGADSIDRFRKPLHNARRLSRSSDNSEDPACKLRSSRRWQVAKLPVSGDLTTPNPGMIVHVAEIFLPSSTAIGSSMSSAAGQSSTCCRHLGIQLEVGGAISQLLPNPLS